MSLRRVIPLFDRVLIRRVVAQQKTVAGIILPESSMPKVNQGVVVAVGPGLRTESGATIPVAVAEGDKVLLPEYGGTKVQIGQSNSNDGDGEYVMFRDADILAVIKE